MEVRDYLFEPISVHVEETDAVVPAVRHEDVPGLVHTNPSRVGELTLTSPGPSKPLHLLHLLRVQHVHMIQTKISDVQFGPSKGEEPALGQRTLPNDLCQ